MMIWNKKDISSETVKKTSEKFNIDLLSSSILTRREITETGEIKFVLEDDLKYTHIPFLFVEMEDAVERILQAKEEEEKVMVYGDRDVDGITSTVLLYQELKSMEIDVYWKVPAGDESYGLSEDDIRGFSDNDITLLITVDCGISNKNEIALASEQGIDVIVTDHHIPPEELPPALAIINPKLEEGGYPFEFLAGCAVVSKLVWALRFTRTPFYNHSVCLINCVPGNDSIQIEGIKLVNMVETDSIREVLVPGIASLDHPRLNDFLVGQELFVFNAEQQKKMLQKIFGQDTEIGLSDLSGQIFEVFPSLKGWSLFRMVEKSRLSRYSDGKPSEIEVLKYLFSSVVFEKYPRLYQEFNQDLDLVALGTIADLMPLSGENRILVKNGLKSIAQTRRVGLKELLFCQNLQGKTLSAVDVSWQLAPVINATGRLGVPHKAVELLLCDNPEDARRLTQEVLEINKKRKDLGEQLWDMVLDESKESFEKYDGKMVLIMNENMHRGITGIIANRLVNFYKVPAVVLAYIDDKIVGSMRSVPGINAKNFLEKMKELFNDHGGHEMAAGFNLQKKDLEIFLETLEARIDELSIPEDIEESLDIDAEIPHKYMNPDLIKIVDMFEPYGEGNNQLTFLVKKAFIDDISLMGKSDPQHVRMLVTAGENKWPAVYWKASDKVGKLLDNGAEIDIVFSVGRNYFQNRENLQLTILDVQK